MLSQSIYIQKDRDFCWHPFTQHQTERDPIVITRAKGACLYDINDNEILDLISSWWTCIHGHSHPQLNAALIFQAESLEHVMFAGFTHPTAIDLAEKLSSLLPGNLNKVFFSDNGSTAVEVSIKMAYQYWRNKGDKKRKKFIAFEGAYHGDTLGAMSVGKGSNFFNIYKDLMFSIDMIPYPHTWEGDEDIDKKEEESLKKFTKILECHKEKIAALIVEPLMQGSAGIRLCRPQFMKAIVEMAQKNDVLVIFDEVAVGFGRTGDLFACHKIDCQPDLICLSKGLTSGYMPLSVTVATDTIYKAFKNTDFNYAFLHGHSFTANPLACAIALKSLEIFENENVLEEVARIEASHRKFLLKISAHPMVHGFVG